MNAIHIQLSSVGGKTPKASNLNPLSAQQKNQGQQINVPVMNASGSS